MTKARLAGFTSVLVLILFIGGALSAADSTYQVVTYREEFDGWSTVTLQKNYLPIDTNNFTVAFNVKVLHSSNGETHYFLLIDDKSELLLNVKPGESLVMLINGVRLGLSASSGGDISKEGFSYRESIQYEISRTDLLNLSTAKTAKIKVICNRRDVKFTLSRSNLVRIRRFVREHVLNETTADHSAKVSQLEKRKKEKIN